MFERQEIMVRIVKSRVGVLIGPEGETKSYIEKKTGTKIEINSEEGEITISSTPQSTDPVAIWQARDIVTAIGRGFSPERAFSLLNEEKKLEILDIYDICGKSKSNLMRIKGRIIGENGKTRRMIEEITEVSISIYGHTISIIAELLSLDIAKKGIMMLINGSEHSSVYRFLQNKRNMIKKSKISIWKPFQVEEE